MQLMSLISGRRGVQPEVVGPAKAESAQMYYRVAGTGLYETVYLLATPWSLNARDGVLNNQLVKGTAWKVDSRDI